MLVDALIGEVPGVCDDVQQVREVPILQDAWAGSLDAPFETRFWWWFLDTFTEDPRQRARQHAVADEIRRTFLDLARLHYAQTGEATVFPERLVRCLERRLLGALVATSGREIATGARRHPLARVSQSVRRLTTEATWRTA